MSVTALQIITRALRSIGVNDTLSSGEKTERLADLNDLLGSWQLDRLKVETVTQESFTLVADDGDYTIGSGGDLDTVRPIKVEDAWIQDSNSNRYDLSLDMTLEQYNNLTDTQLVSGIPRYIIYDPQPTLGVIYLYDRPDSAYTLYLRSRKPFTEISAITDTLTLQDGMALALRYQLAIMFSQVYDKPITPATWRLARQAMERIEQNNFRPIILTSDYDMPRTANILTGG